jgi:hypothetical protein
LSFKDGDLMTQGQDLDVFVLSPIGSSRSAAKVLVTVI